MESSFELPREVALAWGADGGPRRGRKPRLDLDRITAAAIVVADTEGLATLSMNRVASDLGVSPMSLYRYVRSKDELVQLMADAALGDPEIPDPLDGDWRTNLTVWANGASGSFRRHPWLTEVPVSQLPAMPRNIAWMDYALRILAHTPLTHQERLSVIVLLNGHARTEATTSTQLAQGRAAAGRSNEDQDDVYARTMDAVVEAERFPALRVIVDEHILTPGTGSPDAAEKIFLFGLDRILDGIEALIERRSR
ncbi:TetR/AcrR family transcriptional regulator [Promicromonospora vindobonensis]|uniref:TetR/AcrR family transcriptional regulator n=1 Tax=Promicromonospora vindobonensis TaxID=195748 RepID=A0ABW5VWI3_9MICO